MSKEFELLMKHIVELFYYPWKQDYEKVFAQTAKFHTRKKYKNTTLSI